MEIQFAIAHVIHNRVGFVDWNRRWEKLSRGQERHKAGRRCHRLRPSLVRRAICRATTELWDAGRIPAEALTQLEQLFLDYDAELLFRYGKPRPSEVPLVPGCDKLGMTREKWLNGLDDSAYGPHVRKLDDSLVLAEDTRVRWLTDHAPEERRESLMKLTSADSGSVASVEQRTFKTMYHVCAGDYHARVADLAPTELIVQNLGFRFDSPGSNWLALNPAAAVQCGWVPSNDGFLSWNDRDGRLMVHTTWWQDGSVDSGDDHSRNLVGEGWLVSGTRDACRILTQKFGVFDRRLRTTRSFVDPGCRGRERNVEHTEPVQFT